MVGTVVYTGRLRLPPLPIAALWPTPSPNTPLHTGSLALTSSTSIYSFPSSYSSSFSWEYPAKQGIGCNINSPNDSANFLSFLQEMRTVASNLTLSAATSIAPWVGSAGTPLTDVSAYAGYLDWIGTYLSLDVFTSAYPSSRGYELRPLRNFQQCHRPQLSS